MRIANDWRNHARELAVLVGIGTFLTIINPYGATNGLTPLQSWLYWTGLVIYGTIVGSITTFLLKKWLAAWPVWVEVLCITSVTALGITPVLIGIHFLLGGGMSASYIPMLYALVWVISAAMTGLGYLRDRLSEAGNRQSDAAGAGRPDALRAFMSRLPLPYRNAELYAIASEDHYLRIYTSAGEHMMLERLANAVRELEGAGGLQTHRSWWVSETGVKSARRHSGRIILEIKSGAEVPVSRTYTKAVREAGWV